MALKGVAYPSGGSSLNTIFVDDRWGSAIGNSVFDAAPVLAAISRPHDYYMDFDDFNGFDYQPGLTNDTPNYTVTLVNSATTPLLLDSANPGGILLFTTTGAANDAVQIQKNTCFNLHATKELYYEAAFSINTTASSQIHIGLSVTDTSLAASDPTNGVFFSKDSGDNNLDFVTAATTATDVDTTVDTADATQVRVGFIATTSSVRAYVNGTLVTTSTTTIPAASADLRPSIAILTGTTAARVLSVDYVRILQAR